MNASSRWITGAIRQFQYDVGSLVPPIFEAYARVFHPAYRLVQRMPDPREIAVSWKAVAEANGRVAHPAMEWGSLVGSWQMQNQPGLWDRRPDTGRLPVHVTKALSLLLKQTSRADRVMYALWNGYGGMQIENAELIELPHRPMYLITGSIEDATEPFGIPGRTASLWWPRDQQWCVATDVDLMTTYVGGGANCVEAIINSDALEAMPVTIDQRVTWDADTVNPLPDSP
jgi:hypothetical protein